MLRTVTCGELRAGDAGKNVSLAGWVHRRRDHGGLIFLDLRDRDGVTQLVFNPAEAPEAHAAASAVRNEYVLAVDGVVGDRPEGTRNPHIDTGDIEVRVHAARVLSPSKAPPFPISDESDVDESVRLKYRYLDLRRGRMQRNLLLRHRVIKLIRDVLDDRRFVEIETPILGKSTPEGARDFLVPSRVYPGSFYALPQAPQQYKQLLMVAGLERYFQIARCFRDEDSRSDRVVEFTQLDLEMSFVQEEDVMSLIEELMTNIVETFAPGQLWKCPFPRLTYHDAMDRFGVDRPDLRFGMELIDVSDRVRGSQFSVFATALDTGGQVKGMVVPGCATYSRRELDELTTVARQAGAKGLVTASLTAEGVRSPASRFFQEGQLDTLLRSMGAQNGDLVVFVADAAPVVAKVLGRLRNDLGKRLGLADPDTIALCWVVDFPLLEWNEEEHRYQAMHNPFSAPKDEDYGLLETRAQDAMAKQYDIVWNGFEVGGGSVRIHERQYLEQVFRAIGLRNDEIQEQFGHMLEAFDYGAPPHGGIALGLDRIIALLAHEDSIREVIAFPKNQSAFDPMMGAPAAVDDRQLKELHIATRTTTPSEIPDVPPS